MFFHFRSPLSAQSPASLFRLTGPISVRSDNEGLIRVLNMHVLSHTHTLSLSLSLSLSILGFGALSLSLYIYLFIYEVFWNMIFWLVLKLEISNYKSSNFPTFLEWCPLSQAFMEF
jgi:hypothetical protein